MKYNIKVFIAIVLLIIIIPLDGIFLIKILNNQKENSPVTQKKYQEIEKNLFLIDEAVKILDTRSPLTLEVKEATSGNKTISNSSPSVKILGKLKLQILNASNITGKASILNDKLKTSNIFSDITLGNVTATGSSILQSKKGIPTETYQKIINLIVKDLPIYKEETLPDNELYDLIIIIGNNN